MSTHDSILLLIAAATGIYQLLLFGLLAAAVRNGKSGKVSLIPGWLCVLTLLLFIIW